MPVRIRRLLFEEVTRRSVVDRTSFGAMLLHLAIRLETEVIAPNFGVLAPTSQKEYDRHDRKPGPDVRVAQEHSRHAAGATRRPDQTIAGREPPALWPQEMKMKGFDKGLLFISVLYPHPTKKPSDYAELN